MACAAEPTALDSSLGRSAEFAVHRHGRRNVDRIHPLGQLGAGEGHFRGGGRPRRSTDSRLGRQRLEARLHALVEGDDAVAVEVRAAVGARAAEEFGDVVDRAVAVAVEREQSVVRADPETEAEVFNLTKAKSCADPKMASAMGSFTQGVETVSDPIALEAANGAFELFEYNFTSSAHFLDLFTFC